MQVVDDGSLPDGHDVVIVERRSPLPAVMLLAGRPAQVWRAMRAWECSHDQPASPSKLLAAVS